MKLRVISDLHIYNKTLNRERALSMLSDVDLLSILKRRRLLIKESGLAFAAKFAEYQCEENGTGVLF